MKNKLFLFLMILATVGVSASAAFFSVFGLSRLFAGASVSVIIMASSLEFAKLISASFLYRYWDKINVLFKGYLTVALVILVLVTSAGIFGYLSNAYQSATTSFEKQSTQLQVYQEQLVDLKIDKGFLMGEMTEQVQSLPDNYVTVKRKLRNEYMDKISPLSDRIQELTIKSADLKVELIETGVDVGPVIYIARAFDTDIDTVVKFFIFILIFVFDPLAIVLVIATNKVIMDNFDEVKVEKKKGGSWFDWFKPKKKESMYGDDLGPAGHPELEDELPTEKIPTPSVRQELKP